MGNKLAGDLRAWLKLSLLANFEKNVAYDGAALLWDRVVKCTLSWPFRALRCPFGPNIMQISAEVMISAVTL
jgi:hypothetical protein